MLWPQLSPWPGGALSAQTPSPSIEAWPQASFSPWPVPARGSCRDTRTVQASACPFIHHPEGNTQACTSEAVSTLRTSVRGGEGGRHPLLSNSDPPQTAVPKIQLGSGTNEPGTPRLLSPALDTGSGLSQWWPPVFGQIRSQAQRGSLPGGGPDPKATPGKVRSLSRSALQGPCPTPAFTGLSPNGALA